MIPALFQKRLRLRLPVLPLALAIAMLAPAWAASAFNPTARQTETLPADELLREAVANEKPDAINGYFAWMDRLQKPHGSVTKLMVDTPQGILSRTVAIDDRALSTGERQQDDERINRLLDPRMMHEKAKKQQEDQQHIERLLHALPDAFHCSYTPTLVTKIPIDGLVNLSCSPNPAFSPPNYETQVLQGMKTEITIDRDERRITSIAGTLFKDVNFGWGLVARLNRGGRIEILQSRVAGAHWGMTHMQLLFDGRIVVLKPLHVEETESSWNYRAVPGMSVAQALDFLRDESSRIDPAAPIRQARGAKE